ncbi:ATP-binding protein [Streptomyces rimosus]
MCELRTLVIPSAGGAPPYSRSVPRTAESAAVARHLVRVALDAWDLHQLTEDAMLVMSELVSNAVRHARGSCLRVTVTRAAHHRVRVAVIDKDRTYPYRKTVSTDSPSGRGLHLVAAVSDGWGVDLLPWGKRVWAEVAEDCSDHGAA